MKRKIILLTSSFVLFAFSAVFSQNRMPVIDTVLVSQNADNFLVEIEYGAHDPDADTLLILVKVSNDGGQTFNVPAYSFSGAYGLGQYSGAQKKIYWDAVADYPEQFGDNFVVKLYASDAKIEAQTNIASGLFMMGEQGVADPVHEVNLDRYGVCPHTVSNEEYRLFCDMTNREYPQEGGTYQPPMGYFANYANYPVVGVSWYEAATYCNWLSNLSGLDTCYNLTTWEYDSTKNGYHLPTEAQWEKSVRGGLVDMTYPWGNEVPTNQANYIGYAGVLRSIMADFDGQGSGTLPVDSLNTNGYGLFHAVGNVWEWCNDWFDHNYYSASPSENPLGPETGYEKVIRGGAWNTSEIKLHCAYRERYNPNTKLYDLGFRVAR